MISQKSRSRYLSITAIGTACSIVLQTGFCYSLAWAEPLKETTKPLTGEMVLDQTALLALGGPEVGTPDRVTVPLSESTPVPSEDILDSAGVDVTPPSQIPGEAAESIGKAQLSGVDPHEQVIASAQVAEQIKGIVDQVLPQDSPLSVSPEGRLVAAGESPTRTTLSGSVSVDEVEQLTKQIAAKVFELERLNTYFRIESTHVSRWRKWRTLAGDEAAAQTVAAGVLVFIIYSLRGLHRGATQTVIKFHGLNIPGKFYKQPPNTRLEGGFITTIPGIWVGVLQEVYEIGENCFNDWKAKQRGFDAKTTRAKATQIQNEIDKLLAERASLVERTASSPQERELEQAEGKVLKDMRDLALHEYIDYYSRAKRVRTFENTFYLTDIAERTTGFASLLMGLISLHIGTAGRNRLTDLGILQIISAILAPSAPIAGRIVSHYAWKNAQKSVSRDINGINVKTAEAFDADRQHLEDLILNGSANGSSLLSGLSSRTPLYRMEKENLYAIQALRARERRDAKSAFWQSVGIRTFAFGNKTAFGSVAIAGGVVHLNNPRHFDQLLLGATVPYYVTLQASSVDTLRRNISGQVLERRDRAKGYLPRQIYKARLDRLDKMEAIANPTRKISLK